MRGGAAAPVQAGARRGGRAGNGAGGAPNQRVKREPGGRQVVDLDPGRVAGAYRQEMEWQQLLLQQQQERAAFAARAPVLAGASGGVGPSGGASARRVKRERGVSQQAVDLTGARQVARARPADTAILEVCDLTADEAAPAWAARRRRVAQPAAVFTL